MKTGKYMEKIRNKRDRPKNKEIEPLDENMLSVKQAAGIMSICVNAVRCAMKLKRLKSFLVGSRRYTTKADVKLYSDSRWLRLESFDDDELSPMRAADLMNVPVQHLYYLMRKGTLKFYCKKKKTIAIKKKELLRTFGR